MLDDMLSYLQTVRERPVWQPMPEAARIALRVAITNHRSRREDFDQFVAAVAALGAGLAA